MTWKLHFNLGPWFSLLNLCKNLLFTTFKLNLEVLNWLVLLVDLMKFVWLTWGMGLKKMVTNRSFSIAGLKIEFKAGIRSLNSDDLTTPFYVLFFYQPLSFMMLMDSTWKHIKLPFLYNRWLDFKTLSYVCSACFTHLWRILRPGERIKKVHRD